MLRESRLDTRRSSLDVLGPPWVGQGPWPAMYADAARRCTLVLFNKYTVESVLDVVAQPQDRDLDIVELWSGVGSITVAGRQRGHRAEPFDLHRAPGSTDIEGPLCEDLCTETGFLLSGLCPTSSRLGSSCYGTCVFILRVREHSQYETEPQQLSR